MASPANIAAAAAIAGSTSVTYFWLTAAILSAILNAGLRTKREHFIGIGMSGGFKTMQRMATNCR